MGAAIVRSRNEDYSFRLRAGFQRRSGVVHRHFDIVNGFFNRCRVGMIDERQAGNRLAIVDLLTHKYLAEKENNHPHHCDAECHSHRGGVRIVVGGVDSQV